MLKRQTITGRKLRREGRKEDAAQTAKKLLALQIKRRAEQDVERARGYVRLLFPPRAQPLSKSAIDVPQTQPTSLTRIPRITSTSMR